MEVIEKLKPLEDDPEFDPEAGAGQGEIFTEGWELDAGGGGSQKPSQVS